MNFPLKGVGFLIVVRPEAFSLSSEWVYSISPWTKQFGPYYGVDRVAPLCCPKMDFWKHFSLPLESLSSLSIAVCEHVDSHPSHDFIQDWALCKRVIDDLDPNLKFLEILFCETIWESRAKTVFGSVVECSETRLTYGYDMSWPNCNHSAIFQPISKEPAFEIETNLPRLRWQRRLPSHVLNEFGLFACIDEAITFQNQMNREMNPFDFFVFLVHSIHLHHQ